MFINEIHHDPIHEKQGGKFSIHTVVATLSWAIKANWFLEKTKYKANCCATLSQDFDSNWNWYDWVGNKQQLKHIFNQLSNSWVSAGSLLKNTHRSPIPPTQGGYQGAQLPEKTVLHPKQQKYRKLKYHST